MIREEIDSMMWRDRDLPQLIVDLGNTYSEPLPLRIHVLLGQASAALLDQQERMDAAKRACQPVASDLSTTVETILVDAHWRSIYPHLAPTRESADQDGQALL